MVISIYSLLAQQHPAYGYINIFAPRPRAPCIWLYQYIRSSPKITLHMVISIYSLLAQQHPAYGYINIFAPRPRAPCIWLYQYILSSPKSTLHMVISIYSLLALLASNSVPAVNLVRMATRISICCQKNVIMTFREGGGGGGGG